MQLRKTGIDVGEHVARGLLQRNRIDTGFVRSSIPVGNSRDQPEHGGLAHLLDLDCWISVSQIHQVLSSTKDVWCVSENGGTRLIRPVNGAPRVCDHVTQLSVVDLNTRKRGRVFRLNFRRTPREHSGHALGGDLNGVGSHLFPQNRKGNPLLTKPVLYQTQMPFLFDGT